MKNLEYTFSQVNDWIKTADQKAMILGSFNLIGFIYQLINIDKIVVANIYIRCIFLGSIIISLLALYFWVRIIYPKLDNKHRSSKIYFQHIANAYEYDISLGVEELQNIKDEDFQKDLAAQIVINSIIAKKKYVSIQKFVWAFVIQVLLLIIVIYFTHV